MTKATVTQLRPKQPKPKKPDYELFASRINGELTTSIKPCTIEVLLQLMADLEQIKLGLLLNP